MVTNEFRRRVYEITALIPRGKVSTYGQIAFLSGHPRAARIVGALMHTAPSELPCHRVLYRDGGLCPGEVFGGPARQRQMLEEEGVEFLSDGRADVKRFLWHPREEELPGDDVHNLETEGS